MARLPIDRESGRRDARQAIWEALRAAKAEELSLTRKDLAFRAKVNVSTVRDHLRNFVAAGLVGIEEGPASWHRYRLTRDLGPVAPRVNTAGEIVTMGDGRDALWRTIKILKEGTAAEFAAAASQAGTEISEVTAREYLHYLARAGYVVAAGGGKAGHPGRTRYRFLRSTGPQAPQIQRTKAVWDPNIRKVVWTGAGGRISGERADG